MYIIYTNSTIYIKKQIHNVVKSQQNVGQFMPQNNLNLNSNHGYNCGFQYCFTKINSL